MNPLVLYHSNCADGFCAAWVMRKGYPDAEFKPVTHGEPPPDVTGRQVYIVDFCYPAKELCEMAKVAKQITILDHHKTAKAELEKLSEMRDKSIPNTRLISMFDMEKSGGHLAWRHLCHVGKSPNPITFSSESGWDYSANPLPWLVKYTEDRDLWLWKLPNSKAISAWLASVERTFDAWDLFDNPGRKEEEQRVDEGNAILRYQQQTVDSQAANAVEIDMDGYKILSVNATTLISEIGEKLAQDRPFAATYFIRGDGMKIWSLRSRGESGIDVSAIAKNHGGGGHRNAAGFQEKI